MVVPTFKTVTEIMGTIREVTIANEFAKKGDKVVIVGGMPFGEAKEVNMILVETL